MMNQADPRSSFHDSGKDAFDPMLYERALQRIRDNQNLSMGILGGVVGALLGAAGWALVSAITKMDISYAAIGVGILTGLAVRHFGKGVDPQFGISGALLAVLGVAFGRILSACVFIAEGQNIPYFELVGALSFDQMIEIFKSSFGAADIVFYCIALVTGYQYSIRAVKLEDIKPGVSTPEGGQSPRFRKFGPFS